MQLFYLHRAECVNARTAAKARRKNESKEVVELRKLGMETVMNLIYSISPRHTDAYRAAKATPGR